jgi:Ser/Thr protein kinase RdoA (MazF antagonist)
MTFTEWIADVQPGPEINGASDLDDVRGLGRTLRELHDELRSCEADLAGLNELGQDIERLLTHLRPADAQESDTISRLGEELHQLRTAVFTSSLPTQALHGDVSLRNLLRAPGRRVWNDFEDTFRGPVHWDVASYVGSFRGHGGSEDAVREMLDGYGWDDEDTLAPFLAAQDVYDEIWRMYDRQRRGPSRPPAP